jgi:hypothetical protein
MDALSNKSRRPIVVEFLATLFLTFCIGVATSIVLCTAVILMAGEARGAELAPMRAAEARQGPLLFKADTKGETFAAPLLHADGEGAPAEEIRAKVIEFAMTHQLVTKYTSLVAIDRGPARATDLDLRTAGLPTQLPEGQSHEAILGGAPQADALPYGRLP